MANDISNSEDVIDSRDVIARIDELEAIDWGATAENIKQDYTSVEFDGVTYWVR